MLRLIHWHNDQERKHPAYVDVTVCVRSTLTHAPLLRCHINKDNKGAKDRIQKLQ